MNIELGNLIFGCSRGEFEVPRQEGYEGELQRLWDAIAKTDGQKEGSSYGEEFNNEVFSSFTYYWGDCSCGYENLECPEKHTRECYQSEFKHKLRMAGWREVNGVDEPPESFDYDKRKKVESRILKALCQKHSLPYPSGCMAHCTCDRDDRAQAWYCAAGYTEGHKSECPIIRPNFLFKPTGYSLMWYKYPLRDSYSSARLGLPEFSNMINQCIQSLTQPSGRKER